MKFSIPDSEKGADGQTPAPNVGQATADKYQGPIIEEITDEDPEAPCAVANGASSASAPSSAAPAIQGAVELRCLTAADAEEASQVCSGASEPLFDSSADLQAHLEAAGKGICWAARGEQICGVALCGSDGVFGHLLQISVTPEEEVLAKDTKKRLIDRCEQACKERGLRGLRAASAGKEDEALFQGFGWTSHLVWSSPTDDRPHKKGRTNGSSAASSSSRAPPTDPKLRRDGKDVNSFYQAWDKVNVEKALVVEEGLDPGIVPEDQRPLADFGDLDRHLDVSRKICKFSWDQSSTGVSIYVPFDGVGRLPEQDVQVEFRDIGFLLTIQKDGKKHWYKIPNLCNPIDVGASRKSVKTDQVVVKLRKQRASSWSDLTDDKDRQQRRREYRIQHGDLKGATTEELLADMYKNATDEDRAGLRDAMRVNREKREEDARKATEA